MTHEFAPTNIEGAGFALMLGKQWYYLYKENESAGCKTVQGEYDNETVDHSFLVSYSGVSGKRLFTLFSDPEEYWTYQAKFPERERSFYEVIRGAVGQKPHFDIDIGANGKHFLFDEEVLMSLKLAIYKTLAAGDTSVAVGDMMVYSSHGEKKKSYHVIVDGYCHNNNLEARKFYDDVIAHMNPSHTEYVDRAVYSSFQNFRMLGSQKHSSGRTKVSDDGSEAGYGEFLTSMITNVGGCEVLSKYAAVVAQERERINVDLEIGDSQVSKVMELVRDHVAEMGGREGSLVYERAENGLVMLKRVRPTMCRVCGRKHQSENPYVSVRANGRVMLFCRRSDRPEFIGCL